MGLEMNKDCGRFCTNDREWQYHDDRRKLVNQTPGEARHGIISTAEG